MNVIVISKHSTTELISCHDTAKRAEIYLPLDSSSLRSELIAQIRDIRFSRLSLNIL